MSTATIILEDFASEMMMDVSGVLDIVPPIATLDVSANAVYEVSLAAMRSVFTYNTDSLDVIDASASDLIFFVNSSETTGFGGDDLSGVNVANAFVDASAIYTTAAPDKTYVCHDFIRYLASKLFNTHFAVDLFANELDLLNDIRTNCGKTETNYVWGGIIEKMSALGDLPSGSLYDDASSNICCQVFRQLVTQYPERFSDISGDRVPSDPNDPTDTSRYYLPLLEGDSIQFKLTVKPAPGQHDLTGVAEIPPRTYAINLLLKASPSETYNKVATDEPAPTA